MEDIPVLLSDAYEVFIKDKTAEMFRDQSGLLKELKTIFENLMQVRVGVNKKLGTKILIKGLVAKFTQHKELHDLLMATKNATLLEYVVKKPAKINTELMTIRKNLMV